MSATRYRIHTKKGDTVIGVVQGSGGVLVGAPGLARLRAVARGKRSSMYEPKPGHVLVYPLYSAAGNGVGIVVNVRGAKVALVRKS